MNIFSFIITIVNAALLVGSLGGLFLDIPARGELANKERVQTTLLQTISERDAEISAVQKKKDDLEREIPLMPGKIEEVKKTLATREAELVQKRAEQKKASSTIAVLKKTIAEKEKATAQMKNRSFSPGKSGATVFSATFRAPAGEDLAMQKITILDSLHLTNGTISTATSSDILHAELWDSERQIAVASLNGDGTFAFQSADSSLFVIPAGESKTVFVKADIDTSAQNGERHRFDIIGADSLPALSIGNIEKNAPIFVIGNSPETTIVLNDTSEAITAKEGESILFKWSAMNAPEDAKIAIVLDSSDKTQTILVKNLSIAAGNARVKIPQLSSGTYDLLAYLYKNSGDFCLDCEEEKAPTVFSTFRAGEKISIAN
jgi:hypothetical protein